MAVSGGAKRFDGGPEWIYPEGIEDGDVVFFYRRTQGITGVAIFPISESATEYRLSKPVNITGIWQELKNQFQSGPIDRHELLEIISRVSKRHPGILKWFEQNKIFLHRATRQLWTLKATESDIHRLSKLYMDDSINLPVPGEVRGNDLIFLWITGVGFTHLLSVERTSVSAKGPPMGHLVVFDLLGTQVQLAQLEEHGIVHILRYEMYLISASKDWHSFRKMIIKNNPYLAPILSSLLVSALTPKNPHLHRHLLSDAPTQVDRLGFAPIVNALHTFLKSRETQLPLVIAVDAPWGRGKSSFMKMLERKLQPPPRKEKRHPPHLSLRGISVYLRARLRGERDDQRIIRNAVRRYFRAALEFSNRPIDFDLERYVRAPENELPFGQRFLEKIVQFIIYLPEADIQAVHDYIDHLSGAEGPSIIQRAEPATQPAATTSQDAPASSPPTLEEATVASTSLREAAVMEKLSEEYDERTPEIAAVFRTVRDALRSNPRQYVRFFNTLRFQYYLEIQRTQARPDDDRLLLLAKGTTLSLEWPQHYIQHGGDAKQLQAFIESARDSADYDARLRRLLNAKLHDDADARAEANRS